MKRLAFAMSAILAGCGAGHVEVTQTPTHVTPSFEVTDAMWSWWVKPNLLRNGDKTYATFTQTDGSDGLAIFDHSTGAQKRYLLGTDRFTPDDHGAGSVVVGNGRVAVFLEGRDILGQSKLPMYYVEFGENEDPTGIPLKSFPFATDLPAGGSNYPNTYNADGQFFLLSRMTYNLGDQWGYVLNTWPLTAFSPPKVFYASQAYTWPYFATNRSARDSRVFPFALGFHPFSSTHHDIYYGEIHRANGWDVVSRGVVGGNLSTGIGLPLNETSFELVYHAPAGESTRLFNVGDKAVVFATFGADNVAHYKYASKASGKWIVSDVVNGGLPFQGTGVRNYYGGMSIDTIDPRVVTLSRESNGTWYVERYATADDGATWTLLNSIKYSNNIVAARPMAEQLSEEGGSGPLVSMYWFGYYDSVDYTQFNTTLTTAP